MKKLMNKTIKIFLNILILILTIFIYSFFAVGLWFIFGRTTAHIILYVCTSLTIIICCFYK